MKILLKFLLGLFGLDKVNSRLQELEDIRTQDSIKSNKISSDCEFVDLDRIRLDGDIVKLIPDSLAKRYNAIPIGIDDNLIKLAMADPSDILAIDDIRLVTGYDIEPLKAEESAIKRAIDRFFGESMEVDKSNEIDLDEISELVDVDPVVRVFRLIIDVAMKDKISEIRIICDEKPDCGVVYYIENGNRQEVMSIPEDINKRLISYIKTISNLDILKRNILQDGSITYKYEGISYNMLISIVSSSNVENVIMKILK